MSSTRRTIWRFDELRLGLLAALIPIAGAAVVKLGEAGTPSISLPDLRQSALVAAATLAAVILWAVSRFQGDQILLPVISALGGIGFVILLRLEPDLTALDSGFSGIASKQAVFIVAGLAIVALVGRFFDYWTPLRRYRYTILLVCIAMLLVTFVFGTPIYGARLWISIGSVQFQPSEVVKIGLVLFLASYLDENRELIESPWHLGPFRLPPVPYLLPMALMWGTSLLVLVVENDLGSALLLFGIFLVMLYVGTGRPAYILAGLALFAIACWLAFTLFDRVGIRAQNWIDPWRDPLDAGYQQIQSDFAIANGGAVGAGLTRGEPWRVAAIQTDYVFSAIGEELGLIGTVAVLSLFLVLIVRGFAIALRSRDSYLQLVAVGLSAAIGIQTAVILGGVLRLIPLTGITLPYVSYGGSSLLSNCLIAGLLVNISARSDRGIPWSGES